MHVTLPGCPISIMPDERTRKFVLGNVKLFQHAEGKSRFSFEDYVVTVVDQLEQCAN